MANEIDAVWTDLSWFAIRFDETAQSKKLYANGNMQLKVVVEIKAKDENGDPVLLSDTQLLDLQLVDADKSSSEDLGDGWSFSIEDNNLNHTLPSASAYYSASDDSESNGEIQTRVLWVSTSTTGTKKIGATIMSFTNQKTFSTMAERDSTVTCEGIKPIIYTPQHIDCTREVIANGKYNDWSYIVAAHEDERTDKKDWTHINFYIKPFSDIDFAYVTYHFTGEGGHLQSMWQDPGWLTMQDGGEARIKLYQRDTGGTFPLIPFSYSQHNNDLHLFDLWYFLPIERFRNDKGVDDKFMASYRETVTVGTEVSYKSPWHPFTNDGHIRQHTMYTTANITGNNQEGAICVSHVWFKDTNSAEAYKDIDYLRENKVWIEFVDEYGNRGAFGLHIDDDEVKLTSHPLT